MRSAIAVATAIGTLAIPTAVNAKLPSPRSTEIIPRKSIGGVSIGMSAERALKTWGRGSQCTGDSKQANCEWRGTDREGTASFYLDGRGRVNLVQICAGHPGKADVLQWVYAGPLQQWRAGKKIRLGSSIHAAARVYPKLRGTEASGLGGALGAGERTTTFRAGLDGRIFCIDLGDLS